MQAYSMRVSPEASVHRTAIDANSVCPRPKATRQRRVIRCLGNDRFMGIEVHSIRAPRPEVHGSNIGPFAPHLPTDLARVGMAYAVLPSGAVLACALPVSALEEPALASAVTLAPATLPAWLGQPADPERLNVLTGPHEPRVVTVARRRRAAVLTAAVAVLAAGVGLGLERRAAAARADRADAVAALVRLTGSPAAASLGVPADADLESASLTIDRELTRLRATRSKQASLGLADASDPLAALLSRWPRDVKAQAQTLSAAPTQLTVSAMLPAHADAEKLSSALAGTTGWEAGQPQINANGKGVQVQLTLKPTTKGGTP